VGNKKPPYDIFQRILEFPLTIQTALLKIDLNKGISTILLIENAKQPTRNETSLAMICLQTSMGNTSLVKWGSATKQTFVIQACIFKVSKCLSMEINLFKNKNSFHSKMFQFFNLFFREIVS